MKAFISFLLLTCSIVWSNSADSETTRKQQSAPGSSSPEQQLYNTAARNLISQFSHELESTLSAALKENGPAYAVQVCQTRAQEIAAAFSVGGWSIKRVSEKWRNFADRPDSTERSVLSNLAGSANTLGFETRWSGPDTAKVFYYYQKIVTREMCLHCHGDLQTADPELWKQISVAYPYDKATGYKAGDLRGMFVVSAAYPAGEETARRLAEGVSIRDLAPKDSVRTDPQSGQ